MKVKKPRRVYTVNENTLMNWLDWLEEEPSVIGDRIHQVKEEIKLFLNMNEEITEPKEKPSIIMGRLYKTSTTGMLPTYLQGIVVETVSENMSGYISCNLLSQAGNLQPGTAITINERHLKAIPVSEGGVM